MKLSFRNLSPLLGSNIARYGLIIVLVFIVANVGQVVYKRLQTKNDVNQLEKEVASLEDKQKRLSELNSFLKTDFFAEQEARVKLGMQKKGEQAIVLSDGVKTEEQQLIENKAAATNSSPETLKGGSDSSGTTQTEEKLKNPTEWWNFFFSAQK